MKNEKLLTEAIDSIKKRADELANQLMQTVAESVHLVGPKVVATALLSISADVLAGKYGSYSTTPPSATSGSESVPESC